MAACISRQRLSEIAPEGTKYFTEKLATQIYEHFDDQDLIDVTFKISDVSIPAHRLVLSSASAFFKKLFKTDKGFCPLIEIDDIESDIFERLIIFCYTGKTLVDIDNVHHMLKASLILQLDDAVTDCVDFLINNINDYTLQRVYALESETQCDLLKRKIYEYELRNFMSVSQSAEFLTFEANKLQTLIESDELNVENEKNAFEAVKHWYEHDASTRKEQLPNLIACLRLTQFDTNFVMTEIHPLAGCQLLALETLTWTSHPLTRSKLTLKYTNQRGGHEDVLKESLLAISMENMLQKSLKTVLKYDESENKWKNWAKITIDIKESCVIFMDENLIFIGGSLNDTAVNKVYSWSFKTRKIKLLPEMNQPRCHHNVVVFNDKIYAIGGYKTKDEILNSVEMCSVSGGWKVISSMITPRYNAGAVVCNGKIYVIGGNDGQNELKSVECYDPITNLWTQCADTNDVYEYPCRNMDWRTSSFATHNTNGIHFRVTVMRLDCIKINGGYNKTISKSESYDPKTNKWTTVSSSNLHNGGYHYITFNNQLCIIRTQFTDGKRSSDVFFHQNNKWIQKKRFNGRYDFLIVPNAISSIYIKESDVRTPGPNWMIGTNSDCSLARKGEFSIKFPKNS